jgi:peptide/nickel transport system substrate-binding protein
MKFSNGEPFTAKDVQFSLMPVKPDWTIFLKSKMDFVDRLDVVINQVRGLPSGISRRRH